MTEMSEVKVEALSVAVVNDTTMCAVINLSGYWQ